MKPDLFDYQDYQGGPVLDTNEQNDSNAEGDMLMPPFIANAVKMAALHHIERIRKLTPPPQTAERRARSNNLDEDITAMEDRLDRRRILRRMLMSDLRELFQNIVILEDKLTKKRIYTLRWQFMLAGIIGSIIGAAGGTQTKLLEPFTSRLPGYNLPLNPGLIFFSAYLTHAFYDLYKTGRSVSYTALVRRGLERLADCVRNEENFDDRDILCLEGDIWRKVPWKEVEDF